MQESDFLEQLKTVNHSIESREYFSNLLASEARYINYCLKALEEKNNSKEIKAAWILEFYFSRNIHSVIKYLDVIIKVSKTIQHDSAVRPFAKILERTALAHQANQLHLNTKQQEAILAQAFDWLISEQKVAVKAYSMTTILCLGNVFDWAYKELKQQIELNYNKESAAYKARARHILSAINKKEFKK